MCCAPRWRGWTACTRASPARNALMGMGQRLGGVGRPTHTLGQRCAGAPRRRGTPCTSLHWSIGMRRGSPPARDLLPQWAQLRGAPPARAPRCTMEPIGLGCAGGPRRRGAPCRSGIRRGALRRCERSAAQWQQATFLGRLVATHLSSSRLGCAGGSPPARDLLPQRAQ